MVEKYTTSHVITKNLLMAMSTDLFNGTLFFSCSFITQNVYTDRESERGEEEEKNSNVCSMDDLGGALGSSGGLGRSSSGLGSSGDGHIRMTSYKLIGNFLGLFSFLYTGGFLVAASL